jgi:hypothetical protein
MLKLIKYFLEYKIVPPFIVRTAQRFCPLHRSFTFAYLGQMDEAGLFIWSMVVV